MAQTNPVFIRCVRYLGRVVSLHTLLFLMLMLGAGCKPAPVKTGETASRKGSSGGDLQRVVENFQKKISVPPHLRAAFEELYRNNKTHVEASVRSVVSAAKTAVRGTPQEKADLVISSMRTVVVSALNSSIPVLAPIFKMTEDELKTKSKRELEKFLSQKRVELTKSFQKNRFGLPDGIRSFLTAAEVSSLYGIEDSAGQESIAIAMDHTPDFSSAMSLSGDCSASGGAGSPQCSLPEWTVGMMNYGFVVVVAGLAGLIFGAGLFQVVSLGVIPVGVFFFVMGLCARAAGAP